MQRCAMRAFESRWETVAQSVLSSFAALAVIAFVVCLPFSSVRAEQPPVCAKCGKEITDASFKTNGVYYHATCFRCDRCGKPIEGAYTGYNGGNYHRECFEESVAKRCAVCGAVIQGEYLLDYWGNACHLSHRDEIPPCEYCGRFISPGTSGGGERYRDGRHVCNVCKKSAVTKRDEANAILGEVARHMERFGMTVNVGELDLHLVDLDEMREKSGKGSHRLTGYTDFAETRSLLGVPLERRIDVYVLRGMPRIEVISMLAHELCHVWQFRAGRLKNDLAFCEGSCNYASFLVLRNYRSREAEYATGNLIEDRNPVYGEGLRRVRRLAEAEGISVWLERLREKDDFPRGY